jgi:hypothetical protein
MKGIIYVTFLLLLSTLSFSQRITYSEPLREDNRDINFDIIGRMKNNVVVFKNVRYKYALTVYNLNDMSLKEKVDLEFMPDKTFNVDYITFADHFYFVYQYQRKGIVYCMGAKLDYDGHLVGQPIQLDTTHMSTFGDNKIYSTINSEDKKQIMIFKIQKHDDRFNFMTLLLDNELQFIHKSRLSIEYDDHNDAYSDFLLDNEGNFIFSKSVKSNNRSVISSLYLVTKAPQLDTFSVKKLDLNNLFIDEVKMKVDNVNKRYLFNSFYYTEKRGNIEGIFCTIWDIKGDSTYSHVFTKLDDSIRNFAKSKGNIKTALNDFFIRNIVLKKDGSYLLVAEDYSSQTSGSNMGWNRWDYLYGSPYLNSFDFYYYNPAYGGYYRPYGRFGNQSTRYYYDNILLLGINKTGKVEWSKIIDKEQYGDDTDNYLSFSTFITESEIHFLFNLLEKRDKLLTDNTLAFNGTFKRNPTIKSIDRGYEYMPKLSRQIGPRQIVIPCTFRNQVCFARIDF